VALPKAYGYVREHRPDLYRRVVEIGSIPAIHYLRHKDADGLSIGSAVEGAVMDLVMGLLEEGPDHSQR
jgi:hypothetical protein